MKFRNSIDVDRLRELFALNEASGELRWKSRPVRTQWDKIWNTRFAGEIAGTKAGAYRIVVIDYRAFKVHRIIYAMLNGHWPLGEIDHKERDCRDNRKHVLRDATHAENMRNSKMRSNNCSGTKGVCWDSERQRWMAYIDADRRIYLGRFDKKHDAVIAANSARDKYHAEYARRA